jgi:hypothetical protein
MCYDLMERITNEEEDIIFVVKPIFFHLRPFFTKRPIKRTIMDTIDCSKNWKNNTQL